MRSVPLALALALALSRRVCLAAPTGTAWLDVKPAADGCVALVYRFPAAGPGQHCEPEGAAAASARPYYRDTTASDTSWLASNTSLLCDTGAGDTPGHAVVACGPASGRERRYQLRWWPLHYILAKHQRAAHAAAASGYVVAWALLRKGRPLDGAVNLTVQGPADSALRVCVDNGTLCESFERGAYTKAYPPHGTGHLPSARQAGLALHWPPTAPDEQSYQAKVSASREGDRGLDDRDSAAEGAGRPSVAQRIRRMRRMYARLT